MPQILTTNAVIQCPHSGHGTSIPTSNKWSINGGIVLVENDMGTIAGCSSPYQCGGYQLRSMGLNATLIDNRKVILVTDFNLTTTGLPLLITESHSTIDNSTPAAIPAGQTAPPLSPALLDMVPPIVSATSSPLTFSSTTMLPAVLAVTFTLSSAFPLKWLLTRLSLAQGTHGDLTSGSPALADVTPSGGEWLTPFLSVTLKMTATYMAGLGIGMHEFYMTGVSQRGLSGNRKAVLTVS